jgi:hypothetical protein
VALLHRLRTDQSLARYAGWFIPLKIETRGEEWAKWTSRYRYEGSSIPILFVVRADGQQLFGRSGALPGLELLQMINQVLAQAGTVYSDQQLQLLQTTLTRARAAQEAGDVPGAVRELSKLNKLGVPGKLSSFAEPALEVDRLAEQLTEQGRTALAAAKSQLEAEQTAFDGALALAEVRRTYVTLPTLNEEILAELNRMRADDQQRGMLKLAEQLDEARESLQNPAGRRRGLAALERIVAQNPDTRAAALAAQWLREHALDASAEAPDEEAPMEVHTWTSNDGFTVQATLIGYGYAEGSAAPFVRLETRDGRQIEVPFARLSTGSQALAKELVGKLREAAKQP